jgi:adenylylsulfate kinase-like enzyme
MKPKHVVLITGLPGAGKSRFAELLYQRLRNDGCGRIDGERVSKEITFHLKQTPHDHEIHAMSVARMTDMFMAYGNNQYCLVDLVCPTPHIVAAFKAIIRRTSLALTHIWMDTLDTDECKYKDTVALWTPPSDMQFQVIGHHFPEEMKEAVTVILQHLQQAHRGPYPVLL